MTPFEFNELLRSADEERVRDAVLDEARRRLDEEGIEALTVGQLTVVCVASFFAETRCDGVQHFLETSGPLVEYGPHALRRVGLNPYAAILEEVLARCEKYEFEIPAEVNRNAEPSECVEWLPKRAEDRLADLEERFIVLHHANEQEYRTRLRAYIASNESQFVAESTS
jgi:hypothetical protein